MQLEDLRADAHVSGLIPGQTVQLIRVQPLGDDKAHITYRDESGNPREQLVFRHHLERITLVENGRPMAFTASASDFSLAAEAFRMQLAHLFDPMMAVHTSNVMPLPHQIAAVYESMLPRQPLRYVLADDPGAGKTIMAGLLIRELVVRGDADRVLVVAPGSLVEQWQDELEEKFGLDFHIFSREVLRNSRQNPFRKYNHLIARLDQLSRAEDIQELLFDAEWDLVIFDEAHKLSAHYYGNELKKTGRYEMAEQLGAKTRHLLLMTATPHNGKEEDFQAFLALVDSDRFYGKYRDSAHQVDTSDLMRRMVKEQLKTFDDELLFPERRAYTVSYPLSNEEAALYSAVTSYVREQMNAAQRLEGGKKGSVGFALTILQRRLASSPEAIYQSLHRRRKRLEKVLREAKLDHRGLLYTDSKVQDLWYDEDDFEDLTSEERERREESATDAASASRTIEELEKEVVALKDLERRAFELRQAKVDRKWQELSGLLQDRPEMFRADGSRRKIIIFTEHKDTLVYLADRIRGMLGDHEAVRVIYGGTPRDERRKIQELFRQDPRVQVLVATDAAGEGVNLQTTNLMVNYDLPWNPNRLEQRFGRIHRIGQKETCHLWNLVAAETREGDVYIRLLEKLEVAREALGGRVFDIIGDLFEGRSLQDMLLEAIMSNDDTDVKTRVLSGVDDAMDLEHIRQLQQRHGLVEEVMTSEQLFEIKAEMDRAEARKLQPFYIGNFFQRAFDRIDGSLQKREKGRFEIRYVPSSLRERDRLTGLREPVLKRYERICFEKEKVDIGDSKAKADLVHPAHPLMAALLDQTLHDLRPALKEGAIFVDHNDLDGMPRVLFVLDHVIREGNDPDRHASRRLQLVEIDQEGNTRLGGPACYLDYTPATEDEITLARDFLKAAWLEPATLEKAAIDFATAHLVEQHLETVTKSRRDRVTKTLAAVHTRLVKEINYQQDLLEKLKQDVAAGKQPKVQVVNKQRLIEDLSDRLQRRTRELEAQRELSTGMPTVVGAALVLTKRWLNEAQGTPESSADAALRRLVEQIGMKVVQATEEALGNEVRDVSPENLGWDVEAMTPRGELRRIEVKGRRMGAETVTVSYNEQLQALNKPEGYFLALVFTDGQKVDGPHYIAQPFTQEPDPLSASTNFQISGLMKQAFDPRKRTE